MFKMLIGQSPGFESLLRSARMIAATDVTVLLSGETGTGKEILAQAIQRHSARSGGPFVAINCAALPESLAESELFGHRKGAFTGALSDYPGRLRSAEGGTVFFDEIDSLPLALQAKLLRFLETGETQPVGEAQSLRVDVRVLAATNSDLQAKISRGEFRKDLYYRLNVVPLNIPPLRERPGDVMILLQHFMQMYAETHALPAARFGSSALSSLKAHAWPGNVRELRNLCERLSILLSGRVIERENLPAEFQATPARAVSSSFSLPDMGIRLDQVEVDLIRQALTRTHGNRTHSARLLGISRDTLLYRMQKHGLS